MTWVAPGKFYRHRLTGDIVRVTIIEIQDTVARICFHHEDAPDLLHRMPSREFEESYRWVEC
jgi:hypothetical protein